MGLPPLEYSDCFLDTPGFREIISQYEQELENNAIVVKNLVRECKNMIKMTEEFSKSQQSFAHALGAFHFQTIGTEQTEAEIEIANSLQQFSRLILTIEDYRHNMLTAISVRLLKTLETFRKEHMKKAMEEKKRFDQTSKQYYTFLDNYLGKPAKKKTQTTASNPSGLTEADHQFEREKAMFRQVSFDYTCRLQDVHAQKHYELVEPIIGYISDVTTFLHQAYEEALSIKPQLDMVQFQVQLQRECHESEQEKAYQLKAQILEEGEQGMVHHPEFLRMGNLVVAGRRGIAGINWTRYFCEFRKKDQSRVIKFTPLTKERRAGAVPTDEWLVVTDCVRTKFEESERLFCMDISYSRAGQPQKLTLQATGQEDRRCWMSVMEGREPEYFVLKAQSTHGQITQAGERFVEKCMDAIEDRGLEEVGLYRKPGTIGKANKLIKDAVERNVTFDFSDDIEYDTKTLASAIKGYFARQLNEPLMTFKLHPMYIDAAKINDQEKRVEAVKDLVSGLPSANHYLLEMLIAHLRNIADYSDRNLMKASNLGVVFGPTLMRPEHETVASIVDIRYQNIIVELMINKIEDIFPGARLMRPYPRQKGSEGATTPSGRPLSTSSLTDTNTARRRAPPPAPASADSLKKTPDQRSSFPGSGYEIPPVALLTSNKEIPPPPVTQRPAHTAGSHRPHASTVSMGNSENRPGNKFNPMPSQRVTSQYGHKPVPPASKPGGVKRDLKRKDGSPPPPPSQSSKPTNRREPPVRPPPSGTSSAAPSQPHGQRAKTLYDCKAEDDLELSFKKGEILTDVKESEEPDWYQATSEAGKRGLVPANYIEILPS